MKGIKKVLPYFGVIILGAVLGYIIWASFDNEMDRWCADPVFYTENTDICSK